MITIKKTKKTYYTVDQIMALITDFESYPEFLSFCSKASSKAIDNNRVYGTLYINKGPLKKHFTTLNTLIVQPEQTQLNMQLVEGGFKQLNGEWIIKKTDEGCEINLNLTFTMNSGLLNPILSATFEIIAKSMVDAFCQRAKDIYGQ